MRRIDQEMVKILRDVRPYISSFVQDEDRKIEQKLLDRIDSALEHWALHTGRTRAFSGKMRKNEHR